MNGHPRGQPPDKIRLIGHPRNFQSNRVPPIFGLVSEPIFGTDFGRGLCGLLRCCLLAGRSGDGCRGQVLGDLGTWGRAERAQGSYGAGGGRAGLLGDMCIYAAQCLTMGYLPGGCFVCTVSPYRLSAAVKGFARKTGGFIASLLLLWRKICDG